MNAQRGKVTNHKHHSKTTFVDKRKKRQQRGQGRRGVMVEERHRFAQSKRSVQEKKPRENRRRRIVPSFRSLQVKNSTSSHYAQPYSPL